MQGRQTFSDKEKTDAWDEFLDVNDEHDAGASWDQGLAWLRGIAPAMQLTNTPYHHCQSPSGSDWSNVIKEMFVYLCIHFQIGVLNKPSTIPTLSFRAVRLGTKFMWWQRHKSPWPGEEVIESIREGLFNFGAL